MIKQTRSHRSIDMTTIPPDVDVENFYVDEGNFAPVAAELTETDLEVIGEIPVELSGRYVRNGPNPIGGVDRGAHHWFSGNGMVHGVRLDESRACWYRNRWVRGNEVTRALGEPPVPGTDRRAEFSPNTNVGGFAGTTWALVEGGTPPVELSYELDTVLRNDFFGTLPHGFTAHPKLDVATGELHGLCHSWPDLLDHIEYVTVGGDGRVTSVRDIALAGMPMIHDMSLTDDWVVIYDLPVTVDVELALSGSFTFPFRWNPDHGARVGLLSRRDSSAEIIWCDVGECYVFHPMNAYDDDMGRVVIDLCRYDKIFDRDVYGPAGDSLPTLDRWTIDPVGRRVDETRIDDRFHEFPVVRGDRTGRRHRYGYTVGVGEHFAPGATYKHDLTTGLTVAHDHGPGRGSAEASFVARPDGDTEDDGWLVSYVYDANDDRSELVILDARDLTTAPVARVKLPTRVPHGFHGNWIPDTSVSPS